jgi:hypothetical protein
MPSSIIMRVDLESPILAVSERERRTQRAFVKRSVYMRASGPVAMYRDTVYVRAVG